MSKTMIFVLVAGSLIGAARPTLAQESAATAEPRGNQEFIGVDLDNDGVYYNGHDSGRFCVFRTVDVPRMASMWIDSLFVPAPSTV